MEKRKTGPNWAWRTIELIFACIVFSQVTSTGQTLPLINANSRNVTIKDGYVIRAGIWSLSPEVKPDIYGALEPFTEKDITFYTDIDSISFHAKPGMVYEFVILLNGKDTCYTRIEMGKAVSDSHTHQISRERLAMDYMIFRDYLERDHAGLYRYQSKSEINQLFDSGMRSIRSPEDRLDFGKKLMLMISAVQDGHTGTNLSSMIMDTYMDREKLFPLLLYFDDQHAFVRCSKLDKFPAGTEILSIDGTAINKIKAKLFSHLPGDGRIKSKKRNTLNNGSFAFLYRLIFGGRKSFKVLYRGTDRSLRTAVIDAAHVKDFDCDISGLQQKGQDLQLSHLSHGISLMTIRTFDQGRLNRAKLDFPGFLESSFSELKKKGIQKLIIDLRGNGGGFDGYGSMLYAYLARKPFNYFSAVYSANNPYPLKNNSLTNLQQPKTGNFKGEVLFLIDGLSFSCTADFCAIAKSNDRGKFVGEETGGGYYGNNSGQTIRLELPASRIQIIIPKFRYVNAVKKAKYHNRGVIPDYQVIPKLKDIQLNKDVQLEYALKLLEHGNSAGFN